MTFERDGAIASVRIASMSDWSWVADGVRILIQLGVGFFAGLLGWIGFDDIGKASVKTAFPIVFRGAFIAWIAAMTAHAYANQGILAGFSSYLVVTFVGFGARRAKSNEGRS